MDKYIVDKYKNLHSFWKEIHDEFQIILKINFVMKPRDYAVGDYYNYIGTGI